jgi:hypothetical protein
MWAQEGVLRITGLIPPDWLADLRAKIVAGLGAAPEDPRNGAEPLNHAPARDGDSTMRLLNVAGKPGDVVFMRNMTIHAIPEYIGPGPRLCQVVVAAHAQRRRPPAGFLNLRRGIGVLVCRQTSWGSICNALPL